MKVALILIESKKKPNHVVQFCLMLCFMMMCSLFCKTGVCIVAVKYECKWTNGGALHKHWLSLHGYGKFYELLWRPYSCASQLWSCCTYAWSGIFSFFLKNPPIWIFICLICPISLFMLLKVFCCVVVMYLMVMNGGCGWLSSCCI